MREHIDETIPDILIIIETLSKNRQSCPDLLNYTKHFKAAIQLKARGRPSGGICIYANRYLVGRSRVIRSSKENIMAIGIDTDQNDDSTIWTVACYMRPGQNIAYYKQFFNEIEKVTNEISATDNIRNRKPRVYLIGDFNTRLGTMTDDYDQKGHPVKHEHAKEFCKFLVDNNLSITNVVRNILDKTYVGYGYNTKGSVVDYLIANSNDQKIISDFRVLGGMNCDHNLLFVKIGTKITYKQTLPPPNLILNKYTNENIEKIDNVSPIIFNEYSKYAQWVVQELEKNNETNNDSVTQTQSAMDALSRMFEFCWEILLHIAVGYRSSRWWHEESFNPQISNLEIKLRSAIECNSTNQIIKLRSELEKLKNHGIKKSGVHF